jgi:hypothetical protein
VGTAMGVTEGDLGRSGRGPTTPRRNRGHEH